MAISRKLKQNGMMTLAFLGFLSGVLGLADGATGGLKANIADLDVKSDISAVAVNIEGALTVLGPESYDMPAVDLYRKMEISGKKTTNSGRDNSIQISGTGRSYCIIGKNPDGEHSDTGYSLESKKGTSILDSTACGEGNSSDFAGQELTTLFGDPSVSHDTPHGFTNKQGGMVTGGVIAFLIGLGGAYRFADPDDLEEIAAAKKKAIVAPVDEWALLTARLNAVKKEWGSYELDPAKVLSYPALTNMGVQATADFHKALRMADHLQASKVKKGVSASGSPFEKAVLDVEHQFDVMISEARRMKWNNFTDKEKANLRKAQNLLNIAVNSASSEHERQVAYKQLLKEIEGIVVFRKATVLELESKVMPAIEANFIHQIIPGINITEKEKVQIKA